jgi:RNA polymerase-binding protein DksA
MCEAEGMEVDRSRRELLIRVSSFPRQRPLIHVNAAGRGARIVILSHSRSGKRHDMSHLTAAQLTHLSSLLHERSRALREEIRTQLLASEQQHHVDLATRVYDAADDAMADVLADLDLAAIHRDVEELREVDAAIARLHSESYGVCTACGADIEYARLAAQPGARRCVTCEALHERLYEHPRTPTL